MSVTPLRPILIAPAGYAAAEPVAPALPSLEGLARALHREARVMPQHVMQAMAQQRRNQGRLVDTLLSNGHAEAAWLYPVIARHWSVGLADLAAIPPDQRLIDRVDPVTCLRHGVLPWQLRGGATVIASACASGMECATSTKSTVNGPSFN